MALLRPEKAIGAGRKADPILQGTWSEVLKPDPAAARTENDEGWGGES